jgi:hypothetical protein
MKQRTHEKLAIAKRVQPVACALPAKQQGPAVLARMKGTVEILGDIVASTGERWQADER